LKRNVLLGKVFRRPVFLAALLILVAAGWIAASAGAGGGTPRVPVLVYHDFWENDSDDSNRFTSGARFAAEMEYLHANGYHVIPLRKLINHMQYGEELPEKPVVITFDDGYRGNYTIAYPILKKYGMPATIFVIAGFDWYPVHEKDHPRLSWEEMREMEESGLIDIQAHTYDLHYRAVAGRRGTSRKPAVIARIYLPGEDRLETREEYEERLYNDFLKARAAIRANLNKETDIMAWPFGAYNETALALARKAGFKYFVTMQVGLNRRGDSVEAIKRISEKQNIPLDEFAKLVDPDHFYLKHFIQVVDSYKDHLENILSLSNRAYLQEVAA